MAATRKKEDRGAALERLRLALREGHIENIYLFHGEETYLRERYVEQIRAALIPEGFAEFNDHRLQGKGLSIQELSEAVEAMPMMAEHTLVTVTDLDLFKLDERQRNQIIELLSDFPPYCTLIFIYDLIPYKRDGKMKKLCAALDGAVREVEFPQQGRAQLLKWIKRRFAATGHDIDTTTADHLLFTCGSLMTELIPEIEKIGAYAKGESVTIADINAVADPILDARIFDMTGAVTAGKYDEAAHTLGELLRMQTEPIAILAATGKELRRLYTARLALDGGKDRYWLKQLWGMSSDYPAKLLMQAARRVDHEWCRRAVKECQVLDRRMKSERNMDSEAELKLFLMGLAAKA
jgi:DNA polymerase-3 subunit delta